VVVSRDKVYGIEPLGHLPFVKTPVWTREKFSEKPQPDNPKYVRWQNWCVLEKGTFDGHRVLVNRLNNVYGENKFLVRNSVHNIGKFTKQVREMLKIKPNQPVSSVEKMLELARKFHQVAPWMENLPGVICNPNLSYGQLNGVIIKQHPVVSNLFDVSMEILLQGLPRPGFILDTRTKAQISILRIMFAICEKAGLSSELRTYRNFLDHSPGSTHANPYYARTGFGVLVVLSKVTGLHLNSFSSSASWVSRRRFSRFTASEFRINIAVLGNIREARSVCKICFEETSGYGFLECSNNHRACLECYESWYSRLKASGASTIICALESEGCRAHFEPDTFFAKLNKQDLKHQWELDQLYRSLAENPNVVKCTNSDCSYPSIAEPTDLEQNGYIIECPYCNHFGCHLCDPPTNLGTQEKWFEFLASGQEHEHVRNPAPIWQNKVATVFDQAIGNCPECHRKGIKTADTCNVVKCDVCMIYYCNQCSTHLGTDGGAAHDQFNPDASHHKPSLNCPLFPTQDEENSIRAKHMRQEFLQWFASLDEESKENVIHYAKNVVCLHFPFFPNRNWEIM